MVSKPSQALTNSDAVLVNATLFVTLTCFAEFLSHVGKCVREVSCCTECAEARRAHSHILPALAQLEGYPCDAATTERLAYLVPRLRQVLGVYTSSPVAELPMLLALSLALIFLALWLLGFASGRWRRQVAFAYLTAMVLNDTVLPGALLWLMGPATITTHAIHILPILFTGPLIAAFFTLPLGFVTFYSACTVVGTAISCLALRSKEPVLLPMGHGHLIHVAVNSILASMAACAYSRYRAWFWTSCLRPAFHACGRLLSGPAWWTTAPTNNRKRMKGPQCAASTRCQKPENACLSAATTHASGVSVVRRGAATAAGIGRSVAVQPAIPAVPATSRPASRLFPHPPQALAGQIETSPAGQPPGVTADVAGDAQDHYCAIVAGAAAVAASGSAASRALAPVSASAPVPAVTGAAAAATVAVAPLPPQPLSPTRTRAPPATALAAIPRRAVGVPQSQQQQAQDDVCEVRGDQQAAPRQPVSSVGVLGQLEDTAQQLAAAGAGTPEGTQWHVLRPQLQTRLQTRPPQAPSGHPDSRTARTCRASYGPYSGSAGSAAASVVMTTPQPFHAPQGAMPPGADGPQTSISNTPGSNNSTSTGNSPGSSAKSSNGCRNHESSGSSGPRGLCRGDACNAGRMLHRARELVGRSAGACEYEGGMPLLRLTFRLPSTSAGRDSPPDWEGEVLHGVLCRCGRGCVGGEGEGMPMTRREGHSCAGLRGRSREMPHNMM
ncbi:hypothetical protein Agub_g13377 [Astrephomene gubernaculifera]|uniref:Uncharacterized protein n=1 Tax=Astrephomene gubernaculifera TaxID=47775 RepID=A0AAD3DZQ4_9CHLO|nr:hypothetical protein Agub_g13377 [Astrephomene gubernaculifera]